MREAHIEMHALIQSIKEHSDIPSTFDGEIPEYAPEWLQEVATTTGSR